MIKQYIKYFLFICLSLFIQAALGRLFFYAPDFLLVLTIALAFIMPNSFGLVIAFFLGLTSDLASGVYLGPFAASYVCVFCFAGAISRRVFADRMMAVMGITFVSCLVKSLVFTIFVWYFTGDSLFKIKSFLIEAGLSTLISPIVFSLFIGRLVKKSQGGRSLPSLSRLANERSNF